MLCARLIRRGLTVRARRVRVRRDRRSPFEVRLPFAENVKVRRFVDRELCHRRWADATMRAVACARAAARRQAISEQNYVHQRVWQIFVVYVNRMTAMLSYG